MSDANPFSTALLAWFDRAGRKHLPWQQSPTPYRVWISEIMLQQTQVATVIPYYQRFMQRFPAVRALADAPLDEVLHLWTGLGYYARARNLHRAANRLVDEFGGDFPHSLEQVQSLPGIGRSTAGAILALSREDRHPILDGNVKRVLTRHFGVEGFPGEKKVEARLWALAEQCLPQTRMRDYTQAVMDLGATLCTRSQPRCVECPFVATCVAHRDNLQTALPTPRPKKARPQRMAFVVVALNAAGAILLERRPPAGIWGGLWTFPQFELETDAALFVGAPPTWERLPAYHHAFSHFDLALQPLVLRDVERMQIADAERYCWYDASQPSRIGLAKPVVDIIKQVVSSSCQ